MSKSLAGRSARRTIRRHGDPPCVSGRTSRAPPGAGPARLFTAAGSRLLGNAHNLLTTGHASNDPGPGVVKFPCKYLQYMNRKVPRPLGREIMVLFHDTAIMFFGPLPAAPRALRRRRLLNHISVIPDKMDSSDIGSLGSLDGGREEWREKDRERQRGGEGEIVRTARVM